MDPIVAICVGRANLCAASMSIEDQPYSPPWCAHPLRMATGWFASAVGTVIEL